MHSSIEIRTKDGRRIVLSCYSPERGNGKVLIIAPSGQYTQDFYSAMAMYFREEGFFVITFDYRGMGASAPANLKGFIASMHQWAVQDIDAVILFAKNHYPMQEIVFMGHCVGGEIIGLAQASQYVGRLVLVNSSLSCKKFWPWQQRFRIMASQLAVGFLSRLYGYFPGRRLGFLKDMPGGVIYEWANWCNRSNGLFDKFPDNNYRKLQVPLLSLSFSDDPRCTLRAVEELLNRFSSACITTKRMSPGEAGVSKIGHAGFFDPAMKETLWPLVLQWIEQDELRRSESV